MTYLVAFIVCFIAGIGAGLGTGFAGMSAAAVISPILITFLGMDPYMAVGIALASDVLASAVSAYTYKKNRQPGCEKRRCDDGSRAGVYDGGQLCSQHGTRRDHGQLLGVYDDAAGRQVHRAACHDHQGGHAGRQCPEAAGAVAGLRHGRGFYLRLYRRRRRHDDAAPAHLACWATS